MKPIAELIKQYGTQRKLAVAMGTDQGQISRWVKLDALVTDDGAVWVKKRDGVYGLKLLGVASDQI
jgi:hypothetical protein